MEALDVFVDSVTCGGWKVCKLRRACSRVKERPETLPKKTVIILQLLDNTAFFARTEVVGLIPCRRDAMLTGIWSSHLPSLRLTTMRCASLFSGRRQENSACAIAKIFSCNDDTHATNGSDPVVVFYMISGLERERKDSHALSTTGRIADCQGRNPPMAVDRP